MTEAAKKQPQGTIAFKVLQGLESCNGGHQHWKVGTWYRQEGKLKMCENGFHLTLNPRGWEGDSVYFAEAKGEAAWQDEKCVCREVRLLVRVEQATLDKYYADLKPLSDKQDADLKTLNDKYYADWKTLRDKYDADRKTLSDKYYADRKTLRDKYYADLKTLIRTLYNQQVERKARKKATA